MVAFVCSQNIVLFTMTKRRKSFETGESLNLLLCWACALKRTCFTSFHCTSSLHSASLEGKRSSTVRASGAPYLLGEPEDLEQRELSKYQEGAVEGVAVFEPHQRQGRGSWRAET